MIFNFVNHIYKNSLIILIILFIFKNSVFAKNHIEEDLGPLDDQISSLKNDFNKFFCPSLLAYIGPFFP